MTRDHSGAWVDTRSPEAAAYETGRAMRRAAQLDPPDLGPQDVFGAEDDEPP